MSQIPHHSGYEPNKYLYSNSVDKFYLALSAAFVVFLVWYLDVWLVCTTGQHISYYLGG